MDRYRKIKSIKGKAEVRMNFYLEGENEGNWIEERAPQSWESLVDKEIETSELKN